MTVNQKGRTERIFVNLEAIYPNPDIVGSEMSLEELRAGHRGWLSKVWTPEVTERSPSPVAVLREVVNITAPGFEEPQKAPSTKLVILRDADGVDENGVARAPPREGRQRRMKIKEVNETQISKSQPMSERESATNKTQSKQSYLHLLVQKSRSGKHRKSRP